ncbi:MAG: prolyl-tRNA synthetase associated domain-containing protein [Clostridia bacterium]|nr:prolyl-tRNA synthetase associated domain-containing protein [Clostridia bacterium]
MNKKEIYEYLKEKNIWHEITEHKAVYNMEELSEIDMPYPEADAKNLFIRDDKKKNYYIITVKGDKKVNLKEFRKNNDTRPLTFASESDLMDIMKLIPGAVTPLGLLNDDELKVQLYLDRYFINDAHIVGIHPNDNTATVWLKPEDLISIIKEHGNSVKVIDI